MGVLWCGPDDDEQLEHAAVSLQIKTDSSSGCLIFDLVFVRALTRTRVCTNASVLAHSCRQLWSRFSSLFTRMVGSYPKLVQVRDTFLKRISPLHREDCQVIRTLRPQ